MTQMTKEENLKLLELERASIDLDIYIDEQNEEKCNKIVKFINAKDLDDIIKAKEKEDFWKKILGEDNTLKKISMQSGASLDDFWHAFFLAKRLRASLQCKNKDKYSRKLNWVVDFLIIKGASAIKENDSTSLKYLLLMLELAECTVGEQSLGFSEKAKEILNSKSNKAHFTYWKYHYPALVHYNLGLAKQHMADYRKALREYDGALSDFQKAKKDSDYLNSWNHYVYHPALLQKAEVLIKMQFSYNALTVLKEIDNDSSSFFHRRRRELLKLTCYIDLSDWERFDSHWKETIECENPNSAFLGANSKPVFQTSSVPLDFINAEKPQPSDQKIQFSLISTYNSLVLERAKEQLTQEIKRKSIDIRKLKIFTFIEDYINQCKDNRFDELTLEETILDFIEIVGKLIKKDSGFKETPDDSCREILKKLICTLKNNSFIKEIDSLEKPQVQSETVQKARKVLEGLSDSFLKKWFLKKDGDTYDELPNDVKDFFKFERCLIGKLLDLKERPDLIKREYDKQSLKVRYQLLDTIHQQNYNTLVIPKLQEQLVSIWGDKERNKNRENCITKAIEAIKRDQQFDDPYPFTLKFSDYDNILNREFLRFRKHTTGRSFQPLPAAKTSLYCVNYVGLRRWNSYTPELSFSVGGGHFVFLSKNEGNNKGKVGIGIAVDPGFDFIRNFFRQGFTLTDIDIILLTHGHPDHIRDFPAIVELLHENRERGTDQEKKIYTVMSLGCYERLEDYIVRDPFKFLFYDTIIVDIDESKSEGKILFIYKKDDSKKDRVALIPPEGSPQNNNKNIHICINYLKSFHNDHSESDSYGYILKIKDDKNIGSTMSIGFTGDSKWFPTYAEKFKECDVICSHIGSIAEPKQDQRLKDYTTVGRAERLMRTKNHPYLFGEILFLQDWKEVFQNDKKTLVLISEFGEEMKGKIRCDLAQRLNKSLKKTGSGCWTDIGPLPITPETPDCDYKASCKKGAEAENIVVIPVDVGLRISIPLGKDADTEGGKSKGNDSHPHKIHCAVCDNFVTPNEIDYEVYSHEEAIFYICCTCLRSTSLDVRHSIYQKQHEQGREIEKYENKL